MSLFVHGCAHKTTDDHSYMTENGRIWICSNCGDRRKWGSNWGYYGNIECRHCWTARIDFVYCSDKCLKEYLAKHPNAEK